jgi:hypothetical protein
MTTPLTTPTTQTTMEPCRKCGKALECEQYFSSDMRSSSTMFEGRKGLRSTASVNHRPCPHCRDLKPLFALELKTYKRAILRLLIAAALCGLYFVADPQIFDGENKSLNSFLTWTSIYTGGLFVFFAILNAVSYLMKKKEG